jgi:tetratricopeptide (TPR) repeat protein
MSPAELAQLEHAFATDPNSDAYHPLAEAYLTMGRFMEAMVVCKKGVKAHPDQANPRVLLARVYAEQGKDKKAIEELEGAINTVPKDVPALRMAASLLLKTGENDKGKDYATRAFKADPKDAETRELLNKWKIEVEEEPPPAPPAPPTPVVAPMQVQAPVGVDGMHSPMNDAGALNAMAALNGAPSNGSLPPIVMGTMQGQPANGNYAQPYPPQGYNAVPSNQVPPGYQAPNRPTRPNSMPGGPGAGRSRPSVQRPAIDLSRFEDRDDTTGSHRRVSATNKATGMVTLGFLAIAVIGLGGFYFWSQHRKVTKAAMADALHQTGELLRNDSYNSYKKATETAEQVLKLDPDSIAGHSYLAYIYAIRWGEHGEGDESKQQAQDHLAKAKALHQEHSHLLAAEALVSFYGGDPAAAQSDLEKKVTELEGRGKNSALLEETLGIIQMRNGDLDKATGSLRKALDLAPAEPRIHAAMGDLYRRLGQEVNAWTYYDNALKYAHDHAEAVLGKALLVLEAEHPNYTIAEDLIKRVRDADPPASPREEAMAYLLDSIRLYQLNPKDENAIKQEDKALALDRNNPEIHVLRGRRLIKDGQIDKGLSEIKQAITLDPRRASFYVELARAQMAMPNGAKDAIQSLNTALKTLPGSAKLLTLLGDAYAKSGDIPSAKAQYEKAIGIDKSAKLPDTYLALGELSRKNKEWGRAGEYYDRAQNDFHSQGNGSREAEVYLDEGQMSEERNEDSAKTFDLYKKALAADANYAPNFFFIGKFLAAHAHDKDGRSKAKEALENYLKLDAKGPYAAQAQSVMSDLR